MNVEQVHECLCAGNAKILLRLGGTRQVWAWQTPTEYDDLGPGCLVQDVLEILGASSQRYFPGAWQRANAPWRRGFLRGQPRTHTVQPPARPSGPKQGRNCRLPSKADKSVTSSSGGCQISLPHLSAAWIPNDEKPLLTQTAPAHGDASEHVTTPGYAARLRSKKPSGATIHARIRSPTASPWGGPPEELRANQPHTRSKIPKPARLSSQDANPPAQHDLPVFSWDSLLREYEEGETHEAHRVAAGRLQATQVPQYSHTKGHRISSTRLYRRLPHFRNDHTPVSLPKDPWRWPPETVRLRSGGGFPAAQGCRCRFCRSSSVAVKGLGRSLTPFSFRTESSAPSQETSHAAYSDASAGDTPGRRDPAHRHSNGGDVNLSARLPTDHTAIQIVIKGFQDGRGAETRRRSTCDQQRSKESAHEPRD